MKRRDFITLLGGAAAAWPLGARAQPSNKMLRVGYSGMLPREAPHYTTFVISKLCHAIFRCRVSPGGNSTGIFVSQVELAGKRVELLREGFPNARRGSLSGADMLPQVFRSHYDRDKRHRKGE